MDHSAHISMSGVTLTGIRKVYGPRTVLNRINMELAHGELLCLLGPSGCGKTTLLRILAGFETPDEGQVLLNGQDVTHLPPNKRRMGMVFQAYSLFPNMTALQNVRFGPRVRGLGDGKSQIAEAERLLAMVGLAAHVHKFPHQMSGGQQQRVALARALAVKPDILLLDEPLSALDAKVRTQLRSEIRRIQQETGVTTVFVTHDQEEALSISDRVAVMSEGHVLQMAPPAEIYRTPADAFVARFIGAGGVLAGRAEGPGVRVGAAYLAAHAAGGLASGTEVELFLRPEHVTLTARSEPQPAGAVPVTIDELTFFGSLTRVKLALADGGEGELWADLPSDSAGGLTLSMPAWASWSPEAPRVLAR
ncbi:MAG TPA: ABC transporter ATP-binding protein [Acidisoma sp.]|uniref:ABC transporter ATP-binding protein n=1 Tax=Acidisoma sp. TaxID=1872115 RepID=UPI002BAFA45D|nr:ABC transporter ATP-binding protein [Acidisoma sp.]HTI02257.1 ABC transporter ATP-binding protein [Acidisoma sp.]